MSSNEGNNRIPLEEREKRAWMLGSTLLNTLLAAAKLGWGFFSGSTVVIADAVHSVSDVIGALLVYAAVRFAPHRSARFPLGLHKLEDLAALAAGITVLFVGYEIVRPVILGEPVTEPSVPLATLGFMVAILLIQLIFYLFERKAAERLQSPGLRSDVINWLGDMGAGVVVIAGIGGHMLGIPYAQEVAVVVIGILIFYGAFEVLRDALLSLLDASTAQAEEEQARALIASYPAIDSIRELFIRRAGSALFLRGTLEVDSRAFGEAHRIVDEIAAELKRRVPRLEGVTLHYEPVTRNSRRVVTLFQDDRETVSPSFGAASYLKLDEIDVNGKTTNSRWLSNPYRDEPKGKAIKLAAWMIRERIDTVRFAPSKETMPDSLTELLNTAGIGLETLS